MRDQDIARVLERLSDPRFEVPTVMGENQVIVVESDVTVIREALRKIRDGELTECPGGDCCHVHGHGARVDDATLDELVEIGEMDRYPDVKREMMRRALVIGNTLVAEDGDPLDVLERVSDLEVLREEAGEMME